MRERGDIQTASISQLMAALTYAVSYRLLESRGIWIIIRKYCCYTLSVPSHTITSKDCIGAKVRRRLRVCSITASSCSRSPDRQYHRKCLPIGQMISLIHAVRLHPVAAVFSFLPACVSEAGIPQTTNPSRLN